MSKPRALDLFCGAGGATKGLQRAGFHVTGVDINPQPNYCGDEFFQANALEFPLEGYDFIWASPPCQRYSRQSNCRPGLDAQYPDLIAPIRERLMAQSADYVIENVVGAPLIAPQLLCGHMFGLELYRHRLFETDWLFVAPTHPVHEIPASKAGHYQPGTVMSVAGHCAPINKARSVMEIDWTTRAELAEAIPPVYAEFIGCQALDKWSN